VSQAKIRRATHKDAMSIWRVRTRAIEAIPTSYYDERSLARWAKVSPPDEFADVISDLDVVVAEYHGQIIGWGFLDKKGGRVEALFVDPDFQRRGVASDILTVLEKLARDAGIRSLEIASTLNAASFYEHVGFARSRQTEYHHPDGFNLDCFVMVKELDASVERA
jgi:GNAT superfamily N-acetyltransferase